MLVKEIFDLILCRVTDQNYIAFSSNVGNVGKKVVRREEQNKFSKKFLWWGLSQGPFVIYPDAFLTGLIWQVLPMGYLTSLLLVHQFTF